MAWSWQSCCSTHLKGDFPVGGKRGGQQKGEEEKWEGGKEEEREGGQQPVVCVT